MYFKVRQLVFGICIVVSFLLFACDGKFNDGDVSSSKGSVGQAGESGMQGKVKVALEPPPYDNSIANDDGMKNCVRGYIQAVMNAWMSDFHMKFIRIFANDIETERIFISIDTESKQGRAMVSKALNVSFENVSTSESVNFIDTFEHWDYQYLDSQTKKAVEPVSSIRYSLRYFLVKEDGRWVIGKINERSKPVYSEYTPPRWSLSVEAEK